MKKSSFIALVLGIISSLFLGIGMCMAMLPEWNAFTPGVVIGCIGIILALCTVGVWRKMENKAPIKISGKLIGIILLGILSSLTLGVGMCLVMVWSNIMVGILVGLVGVLMLLCLIPLCIGIK
ncbi:hypothetical protein SAMN05443270_4839 [Lacrimispora sphenoides]|jgi:hypothetical protein|uniref:hypothetical protein n=1 Tax=Lacrimispora sphenoides TaxID=29370 RepID=UPI0008D61C7F|nr:hypothetical protein [Lacrimispora sphenoides]SEU30092.1 hypothetical protein SAMN05443270_4839 [Lacrimispora sphenoides]